MSAMSSERRSAPRLFTAEEIASAARRPSAVSDWLKERRREATRSMSPAERAADFHAHQRLLAKFLEAGNQYRAWQAKTKK